jgi:hypothetical protein
MATTYHDTAPVNGTSEVVSFAITGGVPVSGGVRISYRNDHSPIVPYNASATVLRDALRSMTQIGANGVSATGGPWPATPIVVTGTGHLAVTDLAPFTIDQSTLNAGTAAATVTTPGVTATQRGAIKGDLIITRDTGDWWINQGATAGVPVWKKVTTV